MAAKRRADPTGKEAAFGLIAVRVTPSQRATLERLAEAHGVTLSDAVRHLVESAREAEAKAAKRAARPAA